MLTKCANPNCPATFRYLHEGKLFRLLVDLSNSDIDVERKKSGQREELFWLCQVCAVKMIVSFEKGVGVRVRPLKQAQAAAS